MFFQQRKKRKTPLSKHTLSIFSGKAKINLDKLIIYLCLYLLPFVLLDIQKTYFSYQKHYQQQQLHLKEKLANQLNLSTKELNLLITQKELATDFSKLTHLKNSTKQKSMELAFINKINSQNCKIKGLSFTDIKELSKLTDPYATQMQKANLFIVYDPIHNQSKKQKLSSFLKKRQHDFAIYLIDKSNLQAYSCYQQLWQQFSIQYDQDYQNEFNEQNAWLGSVCAFYKQQLTYRSQALVLPDNDNLCLEKIKLHE